MMQQEVDMDKCATNCVWASHHVVVSLVKLLANLALTFDSCFFVNSACLRFIGLGAQSFVQNTIDIGKSKESPFELIETTKWFLKTNPINHNEDRHNVRRKNEKEVIWGCDKVTWWQGDNVTWEMEESRWVHWAARRGSTGARETTRPWCLRHWFWALMMWDTGS